MNDVSAARNPNSTSKQVSREHDVISTRHVAWQRRGRLQMVSSAENVLPHQGDNLFQKAHYYYKLLLFLPFGSFYEDLSHMKAKKTQTVLQTVTKTHQSWPRTNEIFQWRYLPASTSTGVTILVRFKELIWDFNLKKNFTQLNLLFRIAYFWTYAVKNLQCAVLKEV